MAHAPSVIELRRCLGALKLEAPVQHDHLMGHHTAEWRIHRYRKQRRRKGGKLEWRDYADRERIRPNWIRASKVRAAEARLVELFRGEVFIPPELWDALTLSSGEIEAKRLRGRGHASAS